METCLKCNPLDKNSNLCINCLPLLQTRINAILEEELPQNEGYDSSLFVDPVQDHYECSLCMGAFRDPIHIVDCGHVFCKICLERATREEKMCPKHRGEPFTQTFPDQAKKREVLSLKVKCRKEGCSWNGDLSNLRDHLKKNCGKIQLICLNEGCLEILAREDLYNHLNDHCPFRLIRCEFCEQFVKFNQIKDHKSLVCERFPVPCQFVCGELFPRNEVSDHCLVCQKRPLKCLFADFGCTFQGNKTLLSTHLKNAVSGHLKRTTQRIREQETTIQELKLNNDGLLKKMEDLLTRHEVLLTKHEGLELKYNKTQTTVEKLERETKINKQFYWDINNYQDKYNNAKRLETQTDLYSPHFYTVDGYKFRLRACLNGMARSRNTHTTVLFQLCKGEHDDRLTWPFNKNITMSILSQDDNTEDKIAVIVPADERDAKSCFKKPTADENISISLPTLLAHGEKVKFIKDNVMVVKCVIG